MHSPRARLEIALGQALPSRAAYELARQFRDEGMSQSEMYRLFDEFRSLHKSDTDEAIYDAVLDTMDSIGGWCSPSARLYDVESPGARENAP